MQSKVQQLLPVGGNCYYTAYGLYACEVVYSTVQGELLKVRVTLTSQGDPSLPARVLTIIGTRKAIKENRLNLVFDIHKWALLGRDDEEYLEKKVLIHE